MNKISENALFLSRLKQFHIMNFSHGNIIFKVF